MRLNSRGTLVFSMIILGAVAMNPAIAEEFNLAQSIQKDLVLLGYDPGNVDGEITLKTVVAISKFQAENEMEVTGETTPQLAGILSARTSGPTQPKTITQGENATPGQTEATLVKQSEGATPVPTENASTEAIEQSEGAPPMESAETETVEQSESAPPTESAATETVEIDPAELKAAQQECIERKTAEAREAEKKRRGYTSLASAISRSASQLGSDDVAAATGDIYSAGATASDLSSAAKDLGLTEDDLAECENPL